MVNNEYEWPNCWIRGVMNPKDYQDDPVRLKVISCPFRKWKWITMIWGEERRDFFCTHPAIATKEEVEGARRIGEMVA